MIGLHTRATRLVVPVVLALAGVGGAAAQVIQGRVTDPDDRPVPDALVKLIGADGVQHAYHLTTGDGRYRLEVPGRGEYHIDAEALGWAPYRSTLFEMTGLTGVFPVDLIMTPEPIRIAGIDVSVERMERVAREVRLITGRDVPALRNAPIAIEELQDAWQRG
ncbi:MAG TPA: carboxypeptidase-like regulatory domain-containing protein [Longimicrobiales bacterium]|nr:carboxypeptidase-like regulatory domain-containing protein [Longimicrobiales bacterium]